MSTFRVDLPLVPSLNNAYANRPGGRFPTKATKAWKAEAGWTVRAANPPRIRGPYWLTVLVPLAMRGDVDNRIKLASDLLSKDLGVIPNDTKAVEATCRRDPSVPPGRCVIIVSSVDPAAVNRSPLVEGEVA